jgi:membrane protein YdbS with pleckstrin-like domain
MLWRITGAIQTLFVVAGAAFASYVLLGPGGIPVYLGMLPLVGGVVLLALVIGVVPEVMWRRWRYEIRSYEVDLQRGLIRVTRTLVPMVRVQHVDTRSGPLQRRMGLSTVIFYTAAGPNEIPQLDAETAAEVRDRISELAQRSRDEL